MNQIHYYGHAAYGIFRYVKLGTTYQFVEWSIAKYFLLGFRRGISHFFFISQIQFWWAVNRSMHESTPLKFTKKVLWNIFRISFSDFSKFVFLRCWFFERFALCTKLGCCTTERSPRSLLILAFSNQEWNEITSCLEFCWTFHCCRFFQSIQLWSK